MPTDIIAAVDETAATVLLHAAEAAIGTLHTSGSGSLGPFVADWSAAASFAGGTVSLRAPDTIEIANLEIDYSVDLSLGIDLSFLDFCLPQVCIWTPWGDVCTPTLCLDFPTISVDVPFASSATFTADFGLDVQLSGGVWTVDVVIQSVPAIDVGPAATALVTAIGAAVSLALAAVPGIGWVLSIAAAAVVAAFGVAEITGLLGPIVSLFVDGLRFNLYRQPQTYQILAPAGPYDPAVNVTLAAVAADVRSSDKNELVLSVDL